MKDGVSKKDLGFPVEEMEIRWRMGLKELVCREG